MKAIVVDENSPGKDLRWQEVPEPELAAGEVTVAVHATALNRADLSQRYGRYPPPPGASEILGLEVAGTVAELGPGVDGWEIGQRVAALLPGGGYAERVNVPAGMLMPVPDSLTLEEAAGVPETFLTAYSALFNEGALQRGETVLLHAGASGVGTSGVQMAVRAGATVLATAGSDEKTAFCESLGASLAINYRKEDFAERIAAELPGGVDLVVDPVGRDYFERNLRLLATRGRIVYLAAMSGDRMEISVSALMAKRASLIFSTLRRRSLEEKVELTRSFLERFGADLASGAIGPVIDSVYPVEEAAAAHEHMRANRNIGKIILRVRE